MTRGGGAVIKDVLQDTEHRMKAAVSVLEEDLAGLRTGRASTALVEKLPVDYYGVPTPLFQLASISIPEPQQIAIRPYDPSTLKVVEKAILASDLGLTPSNDGHNVRLNLPPLTEERRHELVRVVHKRLEEAKVAIRNVRRDAINDLREFEREKLISENERDRGMEKVQELTDHYVEKVDEIGERKEQEVMEV
jgi:ribosome recycling factor